MSTPAKQSAAAMLLVPVCIALAVLGYAYELGHFLALGLNPGDYLSAWHYVISALQVVFPIFVALLLATQLMNFFSKKKFEQDDAQNTKKCLAEMPLDNIVGLARMMAQVSLVFRAKLR